MKAIVYRRYGSPDVIAYEDVEKPSPGGDEVLIRVRAASVNPFDWHFMRGEPMFMRIAAGLRKPKLERLGVDVAGVVEATGANAARFKVGDEVFGTARGSFAEYVCAAERGLDLKPGNATFEQAAAVPVAGVTALQSVRDSGRAEPGQRVLINGAAGGVGTFAVQIAKSFGAHITGVCSTRNVEMVKSIGADRVIDYANDDFTKGGAEYDVVIDCIGNHPLSACARVLRPRGTYVAVGAPTGRLIRPLPRLAGAMLQSVWSKKRFAAAVTSHKPNDLPFLRDLIEDGKVRAIIDRRFTLRDTAEAIRYVEMGHARGKVVIVAD